MAQRPGSEPCWVRWLAALSVAFFSFGGWWDLSKLAGEVRDPERTLPRALIYGVTILTVVYILTSAAFMYLVPLEQVTSGETFVAQAGEVLFGKLGGQCIIRHCDRGGIGKPRCRGHVGAARLFCDGPRWTIHSRRCCDSPAIRHTGARDHHSSDARLAAGAPRHLQHDHCPISFLWSSFLSRSQWSRCLCCAAKRPKEHRLSHAGLSLNANHIFDLDRIVAFSIGRGITRNRHSLALALSHWACPFIICCFATGVCNANC